MTREPRTRTHVGLRPPDEVMTLERMGAAHPTRLSFLRVLLRRARAQGWRFDRPVWDIGPQGVGHAVYRLITPERTYALVAFAHDLPAEQRTDRVIATAWDATFTLMDGMPDADDIARLSRNVPKQEAGRVSGRELCLSRANRSVRLFRHVVDALSRGEQPDATEIDSVGYLMRTTAVYGGGKFGAADREVIVDRTECAEPFQVEMMTVWLIRAFTVDLVNHLAQAAGGAKAASLAPDICRRIGVGNSTGLGMAPFLVRHPALINNWILARETALARVRALEGVTETQKMALCDAVDAARENAARWRSDDPIQVERISDLRSDLRTIAARLEDWPEPGDLPWDRLWRWGGRLSVEGREALLALLLEPHGALVDDLTAGMSSTVLPCERIDGQISIGAFRKAFEDDYRWALEMDALSPEAIARFWYVSEDKLEPRIGHRRLDDGAEREQPLGIAQRAHALYSALSGWDDSQPLATFLLAQTDHRDMVRRVQVAARHPYGEVRDNLLAETMRPIDLMRCKLAFFGASRFDPKSDKWVRISLFQDCPHPADILAPP